MMIDIGDLLEKNSYKGYLFEYFHHYLCFYFSRYWPNRVRPNIELYFFNILLEHKQKIHEFFIRK